MIAPAATDDSDMVLLHTAARRGASEIVSRLIARGINPNISNTFGCTAMHLACKNGHKSVVQVLGMMNIVHNPWHGRYSVHLAVMKGKVDVLEELFRVVEVRKGSVADFVNVPDEVTSTIFGNLLLAEPTVGLTPLHYAARLARADMAKVLLNHGASVQIVDNNSMTALHHALGISDDVFKVILTHPGGELGVLIRNKYNATPLHVALRMNHMAAVAQMIEVFTTREVPHDKITKLITTEDANRLHPLQCIIEMGEVDFLTALLPYVEWGSLIGLPFAHSRAFDPDRINWRIPSASLSQTQLPSATDSPYLNRDQRMEETTSLVRAKLERSAGAALGRGGGHGYSHGSPMNKGR